MSARLISRSIARNIVIDTNSLVMSNKFHKAMEKQEGTVFNEAQLYILEIMSRIKDEQTLNELKAVITDFFAKKVEKDLEILEEA